MADDEHGADDVGEKQRPFKVKALDGGAQGSGVAGVEPASPTAANDEALLIRIQALEEQHADLHLAIEALSEKVGRGDLAVARLKKRKLFLKDAITRLRDQLTPDIIA